MINPCLSHDKKTAESTIQDLSSDRSHDITPKLQIMKLQSVSTGIPIITSQHDAFMLDDKSNMKDKMRYSAKLKQQIVCKIHTIWGPFNICCSSI